MAFAVAFAFPSPDGTRLLATTPIAQPTLVYTALCGDGFRARVEFERTQSETANSTGRQSPANFADTGGTVFRVPGTRVDPRTTCVVADDRFLDGANVVTLRRPPADARCSQALYPLLQAAKSRPVVACWPIAQSSSGTQVAIVEFARRLSDALASLVVIDGDRRLYVDYAAKFNGPGADLWRADDGGEIHADSFSVIFLLKRGGTCWVAIDWAGAEGNNLSLQASDSGDQLKEILSTYWYRSPL